MNYYLEEYGSLIKMLSDPIVSIILPSIRAKRLFNFINMIEKMEKMPTYLIIIIPEELVDVIRDYIADKKIKDKVRILIQTRALTEARNKGMVYAFTKLHSNLIWITEDDIEINDEKIIKKIKEKYIKIGQQSKCVIFYGKQKNISKDRIIRPLQLLTIENQRSDLFKKFMRATSQIFLMLHGFEGLPYMVPAATLVINDKCFEQIGLFSTYFDPIGEWSEPDYIYNAMRRFEAKVLYLQDFEVLHNLTSEKFFSISFQIKRIRNVTVYMIKNFSVIGFMKALVASTFLILSYLILLVPQKKDG